MLTPPYLSIRNAATALLIEQGFTMQEALRLIYSETENLTYKDRKLIRTLILREETTEKNRVISTLQKNKLIEYLLVLKSGK